MKEMGLSPTVKTYYAIEDSLVADNVYLKENW